MVLCRRTRAGYFRGQGLPHHPQDAPESFVREGTSLVALPVGHHATGALQQAAESAVAERVAGTDIKSQALGESKVLAC